MEAQRKYIAHTDNQDIQTDDPSKVIATITSDGAIHVKACHEKTHDVWVKSLRDESGQRVAMVIAIPLPADAVGLVRLLDYGFFTAALGHTKVETSTRKIVVTAE